MEIAYYHRISTKKDSKAQLNFSWPLKHWKLNINMQRTVNKSLHSLIVNSCALLFEVDYSSLNKG